MSVSLQRVENVPVAQAATSIEGASESKQSFVEAPWRRFALSHFVIPDASAQGIVKNRFGRGEVAQGTLEWNRI